MMVIWSLVTWGLSDLYAVSRFQFILRDTLMRIWIIGLDIALLYGWCHAIIWNNTSIVFLGSLWTNLVNLQPNTTIFIQNLIPKYQKNDDNHVYLQVNCWTSNIPSQYAVAEQNNRHWASCQIGKITGCACAGNAGTVFLATDFKGNR